MQKKPKLSREEVKKQRALENEKMVYENWQFNHEMGRFKYAFRFGAFTWGIPTFFVYTVIMLVMNFFLKESYKYDLYQAVIAFIFFILFGIAYGMVLWNRNEKIFLKKYPYGRKTKA